MGLVTTTLLALTIVAIVSYPILRKAGTKGFHVGAIFLAAAFLAFLTYIPKVRENKIIYEATNWIPQLNLDFSFRIDGFTLAFALLVTGVGAIVMLYSRWYFSDTDTGIARYSFIFMLFAMSMLGLVVSDNVYLLFIFWEATTILSFMLIGQNHKLQVARSAAFQALTITTLGGLAMLVGLVILDIETGTSSISEMIGLLKTSSPLVQTSIVLILVGALSKSAIFPFHFWLPAAMAAPTPVSAYLHAASMVKAGIFLIAIFGPVIAEIYWLQIVLIALGAITMIWGALRALRQKDLKLLVAHGTVSQLGMLTMLFGLANPTLSVTASILLFAHALSKAPLFLVVGIIDHLYSTRDMTELSGVGRQNKLLAIIGIFAAASMAGLPAFFGFVAKESTLVEVLKLTSSHNAATFVLIIFIIGSALTFAYMMKYVFGAFAIKPNIDESKILHPGSRKILIAPGILVVATILAGVGASTIQNFIEPFLDPSTKPEALALWHGFTLPLAITVIVSVAGIAIYFVASKLSKKLPRYPERATASHIYWLITRGLDISAMRLTGLTQRGSLPFYLAIMFLAFGGMLVWLLLVPGNWPSDLQIMSSWVHIPIALIILVAGIRAAQSKTRFKAVILVGVIGYSMAAIFALNGAPDLALTQALVETITLIAFILVIRRLPIAISVTSRKRIKLFRAVIATTIAVGIGIIALIALGSRTATPVSENFAEMAEMGGHGYNIVNVILVDIRGWDTLGELSVVLAAATGVASLVFLSNRGDNLPKVGRKEAISRLHSHLRKVADPNDSTSDAKWLIAGVTLDPKNRSIILEVVVRIIFHALMMVSIYVLLVGHNLPGGGFAAGLIAGLALVARYLAGGRSELGATVTFDAGRILGTGLAIAVITAIVPMFFGQDALTSSWLDLDLGPLGEISIVSSTFFDIGVYLVVFGLVLDVLRSLGAEIDEHIEQDESNAQKESAK